MTTTFDPYYQWLGIRDPDRPPNHYRLLGVEMCESNIDVVTTAADRQMAHLRTYRHGKNVELSERLLNEVAAAKVCLLDPEKKSRYDHELRQAHAPDAPPLEPPNSSGPEIVLADEVSLSRPGRGVRRRWRGHHIAIALAGASLVALGISLFARYGVWPADDQAAAPTPEIQEDPSPAASVNVESPSAAGDVGHGAQDHDAQDHGDSEAVSPVPAPDNPTPVQPTVGSTEAPWTRAADETARPQFSARKPAGAALTAMSQRKLDVAATMLDSMQSQQPLQNRDQVDQLRLILFAMEQFWRAADAARMSLAVGDQLMYRNQPTRVSAVEAGRIELESVAGVRKRFAVSRAASDRDLMIGLVEHRFSESPPAAWRLIGIFLAIDRHGDTVLAKDYIARAERHGFEAISLLESVDRVSPSAERRVVSVPTRQAPADADTSRRAVPDARAQAEKRRELKGSGRLDQTSAGFIEQARHIDDDDAARYVLLTEAVRLSVSNHDPDVGLRAIEVLAEDFDVDAWKLRYDLLQKLVRNTKGPARRGIANTALGISSQAVEQDNYAQAEQFIDLAISVARGLRENLFRAQLVAKGRRVKQIEKAYNESRDAARKLESQPDDLAASQKVGEFLCFAKGDFKNGLPLLKSGQDATLRKLATRDLATPRNNADRLQLAADWHRLAETRQGLYQLHAIDRARHWYAESLKRQSKENARDIQRTLNEINHLVGRNEQVLDVTRLYPEVAQMGLGELGINENPRLSYANIRALPEIDGKTISRYLWTHAPAKVEYSIPPGAMAFAAIGVMNADSPDGARFQVLVDGQRVFSSPTLKSAGQQVAIRVKLPTTAQRIVLSVDSMTSSKQDQTYWVEPVFTF